MKDLFFLIIGIVFIFGSIFLFFNKKLSQISDITTIRIGENVIQAELADDPDERNLGLSGKSDLREDTGMLFVFDHPAQYGFWMKDMNFPIDIVWIDENKKIVGYKTNVSPESYPETFYPDIPVLYVLELPAGFVESHKISLGQYATI